MAWLSSFKVTVKKLVVILLFVLLIVALHVTSTHIFSIYTMLSTFSSSYFAQTSYTRIKIRDHSQHNVTPNTTRFPAKLSSKPFFLMEKVINPHNFEYIIRPTVACSNQKVELSVCVVTSRDNHAGRSIIRRTWGSYANDTNNKAVLLFFVGSENNKTGTGNPSATESRLQEEASTFGDIVQENYVDSYRNLSLKSMSILKWINTFCPNTKYILKVDDDMYVNIPFLMKSLQEFVANLSSPDAFIVGHVIPDTRPQRDVRSKWYTPHTVYREENFPNFVSGTAYVMTGDAAVLSYEASLRIPMFWLEDVFITGLCARRAQVKVYDSKFFNSGKLVSSGCSFRTMATGHGYTPEEIIKIYSELIDPNLKC